MRYFLTYVAVVFVGLFVALFYRNNLLNSTTPTVRVFGSSSFVAQWGPGPWLKEEFEKVCSCKIEFIDGADSTILMQRLKAEGSQGADLVLGFDQFDLEMANNSFAWRAIDTQGIEFVNEVVPRLGQTNLVPYDWSAMAFVLRPSENSILPRSLDDLFSENWTSSISLTDPRTSSAGLQFLFWVLTTKGEEEGFKYIRKLNAQVHSYGSSWSQSYGLFSKRQVRTTFSYVTSPAYHRIEEKDMDVIAAEFIEGHPLQFEYMGIPENCSQCDLGAKFAQFILSPEGQKTIMQKNYMFPVVKGVKDGSVFSQIPKFKLLPDQVVPNIAERERLLKKWAQIRRGE
jgi:thiamine transport system substrate-binding protein